MQISLHAEAKSEVFYGDLRGPRSKSTTGKASDFRSILLENVLLRAVQLAFAAFPVRPSY